MIAFLIRRLGYSVIVLLVASFLTFVGIRETVNPLAKFAFSKDKTAVLRFKHTQGLDKPIVVQYQHFIVKFVVWQLGDQRPHRATRSPRCCARP